MYPLFGLCGKWALGNRYIKSLQIKILLENNKKYWIKVSDLSILQLHTNLIMIYGFNIKC